MSNRRPLVYVAGPLMSFGSQARNVRNGALACLQLMHAEIDAFCPHLSWFADLFEDSPPGYERWISLDFNIISRCDALYRMEGVSPGADREIELATAQGIPVFYSIDNVIRWAKSQKETS